MSTNKKVITCPNCGKSAIQETFWGDIITKCKYCKYESRVKEKKEGKK